MHSQGHEEAAERYGKIMHGIMSKASGESFTVVKSILRTAVASADGVMFEEGDPANFGSNRMVVYNKLNSSQKSELVEHLPEAIAYQESQGNGGAAKNLKELEMYLAL